MSRDYLLDFVPDFHLDPRRTARLAVELSETPPRWARPTVPLGSHLPAWPKRRRAYRRQRPG